MNTLCLSRLFFLLIAGTIATGTATAQTSSAFLKVYDEATIHSVGKFYMKGNSKLRFGQLKNEFTSDFTKDLYKKAKADRIWGGLLTVTGIAALVAGIALRKNNATAGNILSGGAIVLNIGSLHFNKRSTEQADRAIWQRNREVLAAVM